MQFSIQTKKLTGTGTQHAAQTPQSYLQSHHLHDQHRLKMVDENLSDHPKRFTALHIHFGPLIAKKTHFYNRTFPKQFFA